MSSLDISFETFLFMSVLFLFFFLFFIPSLNGNIRISKDYNCTDTSENANCEQYYVPLKKCNFIIKPKKVINIYEESLRNYVELNPLASACLKCATCIAVASEVHAIFSESVEGCKKKFEIENVITKKLSNLCLAGYRNYDLRKYKSLYTLTDKHKKTTHVNTAMNGKWPKKLREISCLFKDHMEVGKLYKNYLDGPFNMTDYLCRNGGVFRDCLNVGFKEVILPNEEQGILSYIFNCF
ncbi:uncharacterized protein LOC123679644 isoform X1 [Harmonia axyridis]|uniref:uncharacterized protein LOC123679644 isoform X1 n=1 Tax=Harmonia axyridis TaxID=115357 RepID=UPI001E276387|nr:uncharacterized protein LOC123679644 isoform X1 [Harmonia axyridis]